jgi:putative hydrolase of the HAD superfamily/pyrimidine and pyridine-specific 5'-nucleotidase
MADLLLFTATTVVYLLVKRWKRPTIDADLRKALEEGTSLNANELIAAVTADNETLPAGAMRADMRLHNRWHRATYILVRHEPSHLYKDHITNKVEVPLDLSSTHVLVQKRSRHKDYCPGKLDPTPGGVVGFGETCEQNATREIQEEMGIHVSVEVGGNTLERLFTFPYEDNTVRVWGEFYECTYSGMLKDLVIQKEEVEGVMRLSLQELRDMVRDEPERFMPDACYAIQLYLQRKEDIVVKRRLLKGYSSGNLDAYGLRPKPHAIFFDCDDCLYFDNWSVAKQLTFKINEWCVNHGLEPGHSYQLYKQYGTALRGLLAEGYIEDNVEAIDEFLRYVHDIPISELLYRDDKLRSILLDMDPSIPKYIFTASVSHHAKRCIQTLGIEDLFVDVIDCKRCDLETKHSRHSFECAMRVAGVTDPERCLFLDDSVTNIRAARAVGWRSVLVGRIGRDHGQPIESEHAELEIDRIHDVVEFLPELFQVNA